jgi:hypothetical protein
MGQPSRNKFIDWALEAWNNLAETADQGLLSAFGLA